LFARESDNLMPQFAASKKKIARAVLGHSDLKTTRNIYKHSIPESQKRAVAKVAGLVFPSVSEFSAGMGK
jgi:integrase